MRLSHQETRELRDAAVNPLLLSERLDSVLDRLSPRPDEVRVRRASRLEVDWR